jgi:hypothetical protein
MPDGRIDRGEVLAKIEIEPGLGQIAGDDDLVEALVRSRKEVETKVL